MKVTLTPSFELTTQHAASSYGQPVLLHRPTGNVYGPGDTLEAYPRWGMQLGRDVVRRLSRTRQFSEAEQDLIRLFVEGGAE